MKLIKKARLHFNEGKSDKIYEVDLCELATSDSERYLVNFRYGRRGQTLREGTKTSQAVGFEKAQKLFDSVVVSKTNKGYRDIESLPEDESLQSTQSIEPLNQYSVTSVIEILLEKLRAEKKSQKRSRIIWRLGEIGDATKLSLVEQYVGKGHWFEDYSIAWAIGRCGSNHYIQTLRKLQASKSEKVRELAIEAELILLSQHELESRLKAESEATTETIQFFCNQSKNRQELSRNLVEWFKERKASHNDDLVKLYRMILTNQDLRGALIEVLQQIPLKPGYFKAIRHIFKIAELRQDHEVSAILLKRFELGKAYFTNEWGWHYDAQSGRSIKVADELKKPNTKLAFSNKTRDYLRRRGWRSLKRIGELNDLRYLDMVLPVLLSIRDEDARKPRVYKSYGWNANTNTYEVVTTNCYGEFAGLLAFNHILFGTSQRFQLAKSRKVWIQLDTNPANRREEAFPEIWNQKPEVAITLLLQSQCLLVHQFAVILLSEHPMVVESIDDGDLADMLASRYEETQTFALAEAEKRLQSGVPSLVLVLGLAKSELVRARELAITWLDDNRAVWNHNLTFIVQLVMTHTQAVGYCLERVLTESPLDSLQQIQTADLILQTSRKVDDFGLEQVDNLMSFFSKNLMQATVDMDVALLGELICESNPALQLLASRLLLLNKIDYMDIPKAILKAISNNEHANIRAVGIELLGGQTTLQICQQLNGIWSLFERGESSERQAVIRLIDKPAKTSSEFASTLFSRAVDLAFKAEQLEGQYADVETLCNYLISINPIIADQGLTWRLLQAQSKAAQSIGASLLASNSTLKFSVKQWSILGKHRQLSVRDWVKKMFTVNRLSIKAEPKSALLLCNSPWIDTREFAFDFFRNHFDETVWNPELIIFLCDNHLEEVQAFGREILQQFFKREQGEDYLIKLSQHPSENVQLFASNFLQDYAANQPENILRLKRYFVTVLSLVNRGRICKDRVFQFLMQEAQRDYRVAQLVAEIFSRQSVTNVLKDKSKLVTGMLQLKKKFPDIHLPLIELNKPIWQASKGIPHGV